jgi:hypothetical protein
VDFHQETVPGQLVAKVIIILSDHAIAVLWHVAQCQKFLFNAQQFIFFHQQVNIPIPRRAMFL